MNRPIALTTRAARQFLLLKQGLLGEHRFMGKQGVMDYIHQTGCIQFDPVDACGKNAELVLQSRVKGFTKQVLSDLLYQDRQLFDYPDKNLCILPISDWPYFARFRDAAKAGGLRFEGLAALENEALEYIQANGAVSSANLPLAGSLHWHSHIHWSGGWDGQTNAARAVLEQLYSTGELVVHHKNGSRKFYDLAEKHLPIALLSAPDPLPDDFAHQCWCVMRRIGAVGLLWNRPSDAWLGIGGLKAPTRHAVFQALLDNGSIVPVQVEGLKDTLYCQREDVPLLESVQQDHAYPPRCEVIAPLDCLLWDRKLIRALFDFEYTWEIYTPADKRKYGCYVLPLLYGEGFVGRIESVNDRKRKTLVVKNIWYESGVHMTKTLTDAVEDCLARLAKFNGCEALTMTDVAITSAASACKQTSLPAR